MSEIENVSAVLQKSLQEISPELRKKLLQKEIFKRWHEIFRTLSDKISPIKIQGDALIVTSNDSAVKDMLKFNAENFVNLINDKISPELPIISEIKFGRSFDEPSIIEEIPAKIQSDEIKIELTPEEVADCEKQVAAVADEDQRQILLETLLSHKKSQKRKLQRGWHKCKLCNLLCPPKKILCSVCEVKERAKMIGEIRKIFITAPETSFREIQQKIIRQFPHFYKECTLEKIDSARMDLILQQAAKISFGDTTSDAALFLVQLIRQLPREKLTEAIINRTLKEFKFNLADLPPFPKHEFSKFEKLTIKKLSTKKIPLQKM